MKKICPICDQELREDLWCERCNRRVALYKTVSDSADSAQTSQSIQSAQPFQHIRTGQSSPSFEKPRTGQDALSSQKVQVRQDVFSFQNMPGQDAFSRAAQPYAAKPRKKVPLAALALFVVGFYAAFAFLIFPLLLSSSSKKAPRPSFRIEEEVEAEDRTLPGASQNLPDTTNASGLPSEDDDKIYSDDWIIMELLTPVFQQPGQNRQTFFYYYDPEDIAQTGLCCYSCHFGTTREELLPLLDAYFSAYYEPYPYEARILEDERGDSNYYADCGDSFTLMFQSELQYSTEHFQCELNYDSGADLLHQVTVHLDYSEDNLEERIPLLQALLTTLSPDYDLSEEELLAVLLTEKKLPPEEIRFCYRDATLCVRLISHGSYYSISLYPISYAEAPEGEGALPGMRYKRPIGTP